MKQKSLDFGKIKTLLSGPGGNNLDLLPMPGFVLKLGLHNYEWT